MCLMAVFAASVRALVTRLVMNTSTAGHHAFRVSASLVVSSVLAAVTQSSRRALACRAASRVVHFRMRRRPSLTPQAAPSSPVWE